MTSRFAVFVDPGPGPGDLSSQLVPFKLIGGTFPSAQAAYIEIAKCAAEIEGGRCWLTVCSVDGDGKPSSKVSVTGKQVLDELFEELAGFRRALTSYGSLAPGDVHALLRVAEALKHMIQNNWRAP